MTTVRSIIPCCVPFGADLREEQFELLEGMWNIKGCCAAGCYVASDIKFCPYCGTKLSELQLAHAGGG